ncbi:hypothetical protein MNBD_ALPHA06-2062 [hydrothermal vent metagenome]|uniref:Peptidase S9 prolyl oligopeptidase catalytic domain-containing protein n=1 Tax=hydrothermal vent metagenome TaxID=652676 RepID=A0A3B0RCG8_9ZZZZ
MVVAYIERFAMKLACLVFILALGLPAYGQTLRRDNGELRSWVSFRPANPGANALPVLFVLHGGGGSAKQIRKHFSFDVLAKKNRFMVIYPDGLEKHWNDARQGGTVKLFTGKKPDDVGFLRQLAALLVANGEADADRIYVTGVSNGGMMVQRLLCEASETFAAGASLIANLPAALADCAPAKPRSILLINGDADPLMPQNGGGVGFRQKRGFVLSTMKSFDHWAAVNQCAATPTSNQLPNQNQTDGTTAAKFVADDCLPAHKVQLISIAGGGHTVPTLRAPSKRLKARLRTRILGATNRDFEAKQMIWDFLQDARAAN